MRVGVESADRAGMTSTQAAQTTPDQTHSTDGLCQLLADGRQISDGIHVANLLGVSLRFIQQETRFGRIPCRRVGDKTRYLLPDDLDVYLASIYDPGAVA